MARDQEGTQRRRRAGKVEVVLRPIGGVLDKVLPRYELHSLRNSFPLVRLDVEKVFVQRAGTASRHPVALLTLRRPKLRRKTIPAFVSEDHAHMT